MGSHELDDPDGIEPAACVNQASAFCEYFALLAPLTVLTPDPAHLLSLGTGRAVGSATHVSAGLAEPIADRLN